MKIRIAAMAACTLTAVACASTSSASTSSAIVAATRDGTTACAFKIALIDTGALAGQAGGLLRFTNDGHATCRVTGWPVVTGLTSSGKASTFRHARSTMFGAWQYSAPLPILTLRPGGSAYAVVAAGDLPVGTRRSCPAPDVRLRVAAPGSKNSVLISAWLPGARSYLPACLSINGTPTGEVSTITTLTKIAH